MHGLGLGKSDSVSFVQAEAFAGLRNSLTPRIHATRSLRSLSGSSSFAKAARAPLIRFPVKCQAAASPARDYDDVQRTKDEIVHLAGNKYGTDRPPDIKGAIANLVDTLGSQRAFNISDMTGSKWKLVYTESMASSSGKIGPFVGKVIQEFPVDKPGVYINWLYLGPATISLAADYKQISKEQIDVTFQYLQVELGIWKWKKDLKARKGTWNAVYLEDNYRVLRANGKNIFILEKVQ